MKLVLSILCVLGFVPYTSAKSTPDGVVRVISYIQRPDHDAPWRSKRIDEDIHMGTVVEPNRILVSGYAAAYAKHFEMQTVSRSKRIPLKLTFVDYHANLALLEPELSSTEMKIAPISFGKDLTVGDAASLLTARQGQKLIDVPLRVRDIVLASGAYTTYGMPHYSFKTQERGGGWSEPLIKAGRLVGITVSKENDLISALPVSVIKAFLKRSRQRPYRGFARLGIHYRPLSSEVMRRYLGAGSVEGGVWVSQVLRHSPYFEKIQPSDILVQVGPYRLDDHGYVRHPLWGTIPFAAVMHEYAVGSVLPLKIVRKGQLVEIAAVLEAYDVNWDLIPAPLPGNDEHLIYGGFVFQKLTEAYLRSWGDKWRSRAPEVLLSQWLYHNQRRTDDDKAIIVLNRVLPDEFNQGYDDLKNLVLVSVNNQPVRSFQQLRAALARPLRDSRRPDFPAYTRLVFEPFNREVILGYAGVSQVHERLAASYGVDRREIFWHLPH